MGETPNLEAIVRKQVKQGEITNYKYCIAGIFFAFFKGRTVTQKIKLGETPTHRYFTCKACGGCGFLALKREYNTTAKISSEVSRAIPRKILRP